MCQESLPEGFDLALNGERRSAPPVGCRRWSLCLLARGVLTLGIVSSIRHETVR